MRPADVPPLEGWITFAEASDLLGISKQGVHKTVFEAETFNRSHVRKVGSKPLYLVSKEAVEAELARRKSTHKEN